jgi:DNA-binding GntR family transcriptional regulator
MRLLMVEKQSLSELVYDRIRRLLLEGELIPGQKILRAELSEKLGVSQTPVNQAISQLIGEGMLEQVPRRGVFVRTIGAEEQANLFQIRASLEGLAGWIIHDTDQCPRLAGEYRPRFQSFSGRRLDDGATAEYLELDKVFHMDLIDSTGNERLKALYRAQLIPEKTYQIGLVRPVAETLGEHFAILDALAGGDRTKSRDLLFSHFILAAERSL